MKNKQLSSKNKNFFKYLQQILGKSDWTRAKASAKSPRSVSVARRKEKIQTFSKNLYKIYWSNSEKEIDPSLSRDVTEERLLESMQIIDITTCEDCLTIGW